MKDDKIPEKVNNTRLGPESEDSFPDWTLTPADVDIEAMLEEARRKMNENGETLEEFIARTMGISIDEYIDMTLSGDSRLTRQIPPVHTQQVPIEMTMQVPLEMTQRIAEGENADARRTIQIGTAAPDAAEDDADIHSTIQADADAFRKGMTGTRTFEPFEEDPQEDFDPGSADSEGTIWSDADGLVPMSGTRVVAEKIDWKQAENEESGYKGNDDRKTYGLTDEDVKDTISMKRPPGLEEPSEEIREFNDRLDKRKKDNEMRRMRGRLRVKILLIALACGIFMFIFSLSPFFTVDAIEVRGNSHFSAEEIINIAHAVPGRNLIYDTGSKEIIDYLKQNPYIKEAVVARKLPSTLVISITERKQACVFRYDDDYLVMDNEGILLKKTRTLPKITVVSGLVVSKMKLGEVVGTKDKKLFGKMLDLIKATSAADIYFVKIDMQPAKDDPDLVKAYIYDTFVVKGKYDLLMANLENGRLHLVIEELFGQNIRRGTITFTEEGTISFEPGL